MSQSRFMSGVEAITNVAVGYGLAVITQVVTFPWFGIEADLHANLAIGLIFTVVSLARSYALRRFFNSMFIGRLLISYRFAKHRAGDIGL